MKMDALQFMVEVPIPFIFGTIVVLNMLQNSLFGKIAQPLRGVVNAVAAMIIGSALAFMYGALSSTLSGPLAAGPPGNDFERWLASALLAVTFPLLIFFAEFFQFWPLKKEQPAA
jgi:predicted membrane protein